MPAFILEVSYLFIYLFFYPYIKLQTCPPVRLGRTVQYSEDSEAGEGQRKRFCLSRDEEDTETGTGGVKKKKKKKKKSWSDQEPSSTHALEVGSLFVDFPIASCPR